MSRPLFTATAEQRRQVKVLSRFGLSPPQLAEVFGLAPATVRKHFHDEIAEGQRLASTARLRGLLVEISSNANAGPEERAGTRSARRRGVGLQPAAARTSSEQ